VTRMTAKQIADLVFLTGSFVGAILVALNIDQAVLGYTVFLISNFAGLYLALISNASRSLAVVTVMFMIINVVGIIRG
jgi:hypothetical protein